jgi:hypothetical protein
MTKAVHSVYIGSMTLVTVAVTAYLAYYGYAYYGTPIEERFYLPMHEMLKPRGIFGHGLGILGTFMVAFGVGIYIARKRYNFMAKYLRLKYLLEFHIFLCILGPILIMFHTSFKFGGIVSISFWSMVLVVLSGVIGRFIYIQIPRTIKGRELSLDEVKDMKTEKYNLILSNENIDESLVGLIQELTEKDESKKGSYFSEMFRQNKIIRSVKKQLKSKNTPKADIKRIIGLLEEEVSLANKIGRLKTMQQLFKYWHVAHLPFALIMLIVLVLHVGVTLAFGYKWIF